MKLLKALSLTIGSVTIGVVIGLGIAKILESVMDTFVITETALLVGVIASIISYFTFVIYKHS